MSEYPKLYIFDLNRRVYKRDETGRSFGGPIYSEHFIPVELTGETDKDWTGPIYHVNKRSRMARWHGRGTRFETYTEAEREAAIWMDDHSYRLREAVGRCKDIDVLKRVAELVGYKG